jgi:HAD superfamily hydrolase (TIGR01549 family)
MIEAVFFDWFHTLAQQDPPREYIFNEAFHDVGLDIPPQPLKRGIVLAEELLFKENSRIPMTQRSPEERLNLQLCYPRTILAEAGINAPDELNIKVLKAAQKHYKEQNFVLFDDVRPTLRLLKENQLKLGLITNLTRELMAQLYQKMDLAPYLDFFITPRDAGADKPSPLIFQVALNRAGVKAEHAIHVGDRYEVDVMGARNAGVSPVLIDRNEIYPEVIDCPRIHSLAELPPLLGM